MRFFAPFAQQQANLAKGYITEKSLTRGANQQTLRSAEEEKSRCHVVMYFFGDFTLESEDSH